MGNSYVVVGATGVVGAEVTSLLARAGHQVRPVARSAGLPIEPSKRLAETFEDADGAFLMVPFDRSAADLHATEQLMATTLANAAAKASVPRIVTLSGTSAHLGLEAGTGAGAAFLEQAVDHAGFAVVTHLRGGFFYENFLNLGLVEQAPSGVFRGLFRADRPLRMVAGADLGQQAARALTAPTAAEHEVREIVGPQAHTIAGATQVLGSAVGVDVVYEQISENEGRAAIVAAGASASFADAVLTSARQFNQGTNWELQPSPDHTGRTTLAEFATKVFAPAYAAAHRSPGN